MYSIFYNGKCVANCNCGYADIQRFRLFVSRALQLPWERLSTRLVVNVNGLAPILPKVDSLTELSAIDLVNK